MPDPRPGDRGHRLLFLEVPDEVLPAKRIHLDLRPRTGTGDDEVGRVLGHGATFVDDLRGVDGPGTGWVVLADPEGNLFCILRSEAELARNESAGAGVD